MHPCWLKVLIKKKYIKINNKNKLPFHFLVYNESIQLLFCICEFVF